jgi:hypothetical protein
MRTLAARITTAVRRIEQLTRPIDPEKRRVLDERWRDLPIGVRTPAQLVGRQAVGCEGTHGVFPKCNLTCSPCYHSSDANKVRVDGDHTIREVERQMSYLRGRRGPRGHAQLIGGEVSLLPPEVHAASLQAMRAYGREPMSMTHGDFDYEYLEAVAVGADGRSRFDRLSFAGHFDSSMRGRRGIARPTSERELDPYRRRFVAMFTRLRREHGVRAYLAHNMTITPSNVDQVADVVRDTLPMGFSMMSFQPAAFVGDDRRWREGFRELTDDDVWAQIEAGVGTRIPFAAAQMGDPRCNRSSFGFVTGGRWFPFLDDTARADIAARDAFLRHLGGITLGGVPWRVALARLVRGGFAHPTVVVTAVRYAAGLLRRVAIPIIRGGGRVRLMTFVMHSFMDAADVAPAWELLQRGVVSDDPAVRVTQERLQACVYTMAHPDSDLLVPACAQHSVFDPAENVELRRLLPLVEVRTGLAVSESADTLT